MSKFYLNRKSFILGSTALLSQSCQHEKHDIDLIESITKETVRKFKNDEVSRWFHPRACMIPGENGRPELFMNIQPINGSDFFGTVHWMSSKNGGRSWSEPEPIGSFAHKPIEKYKGLRQAVCDVVPQYHPQSKTILSLGHNVYYRGNYYSNKDQLSRSPVYAVRRRDGSWSSLKKLEWNDPRGSFIYTNNCGQRIVDEDGDILMSFTFGHNSKGRSVAGVKCSFDGETLKVEKVGNQLESKVGRGLIEPSVTRFAGKYYMTIRAEDNKGYVSISDDGVNYSQQKAWSWEDGSLITMSTTQQHWLTHSDALYLVYTRKDHSNSKVFRWRSPLFVAKVDPENLCLIKSTERIALPLVGDGIKNGKNVPLMGNFDVTNICPDESLISVGSWIHGQKKSGNILLSRIRWSQPNYDI
ncbi:MAG: glycoside hydrolase [Lentisphaeraceae bacterium]|nr:glycoside hydrolase [Lentisphaeraceae bacterium]